MSSEYIFDPEVLSYEEAEQRFGITRAQVEKWDEACCRGDVPGEPVGEVMRGRPLNLDYELSDEIVSDRELEERFGITREQVETWDEAYSRGDVPDEPLKLKTRGRPLKFGEGMQLIGFKEPRRMITLMDSRAQELGMSRSDYLRHLVSEDLKTANLITAD